MTDKRDIWERRADYASEHPIRALLGWGLAITAVTLVIVGFVGVVSTGSVFFKSEASNHTVGSRVNIERNSTSNATASIAFFHDKCNTVNSQLSIYTVNKRRADRLAAQAKADTDPLVQQQDAGVAERAATDADGALNAALAAANDYNAKASNSLNAKFREQGLPEHISMNPDQIPASIDCG